MLHGQNIVETIDFGQIPACQFKSNVPDGLSMDRLNQKILLVEPVATMRRHFATLASRALDEPIELIEADSLEAAMRIISEQAPNMVVLDPGAFEDGAMFIASDVWSRFPSVRMLFWCHSVKDAQMLQIDRAAKELSIYGIVTKCSPDANMIHAIRSLLLHQSSFIDDDLRERVRNADGARKQLTQSEYETLCDVILGLTDKAIALRRNLSARGVQNRLSALFGKLIGAKYSWLKESAKMDIYNLRARLIFEVYRNGLLDECELQMLDHELDYWTRNKFGV